MWNFVMPAQKETTEMTKASSWNCCWDTNSAHSAEVDREGYRQRGDKAGHGRWLLCYCQSSCKPEKLRIHP